MATKKHDQGPSSSKTTIHIANNQYVGISHKGIFGEETYFDENGHYVGTSYKGMGSNRVTILDGDTDSAPKHNSSVAWWFLIFTICFFIVVILIVFR